MVLPTDRLILDFVLLDDAIFVLRADETLGPLELVLLDLSRADPMDDEEELRSFLVFYSVR